MDEQSKREIEGQSILVLLLVVLFFGIQHTGDYWFNHWLGKWGALMGALTLVYAYSIGKYLHPSVGLLFGICQLSAIKSFGWTFVARDSAYTAFTALMFSSFFICFGDARAVLFRKFLALVCAFSVLLTLSQFSLDSFIRGAFSGNASMNGCLIAITLPFLVQMIERRTAPRNLAIGLALLAIFMTNASIPLGAFGAAAFAFAVSKYKNLKSLLKLTAFGAALSVLAFCLQPDSLLNPTGRFLFWERVFNWWVDSKTWLFGMGMGSADMVYQGLFESVARNQDDSIIRWAHNDYLDLLFETGIVGVGAAIAATFYTLRASYNRPYLFAAVSAYVFTAFFNYPMHLPFHAFTGATLIWLTFRGVQD